jgi:molecular chaperone GrpE
MSARAGGKRKDRISATNGGADEAAPPPDDEIEILEVVGVNETERVSPESLPESAPPQEPQDAGASADLEDARRERDRYHDLWLRQQADFDNLRKRAEREAGQRRIADAADLVCRLLPVLDNLERALRASGERDDPLRSGLALIHQQMFDLLGKEGLAPVPTVGTRFDPERHEAVDVVETGDADEGTILEEMQKGYTFKDRLIRPALVRVATGRRVAGADTEPPTAG